MKHYLYRHIRTDTAEPFYIGVGTKKDRQFTIYRAEYARAYQRHKENNIWCKIVNKTEYEVEILLESDEYNFIKQKEIEFIKLYGRIDLGTGILSNMTDGGDGIVNLSQETRDKMSKNMTERWKNEDYKNSLSGINSTWYGRKHTEDTKKTLSEIQKGREGLKGNKNPMYHRRGELSPHFGKPCSQTRKDKISKANSGGNHGMAIKIIDTSTNVIYSNIREAASLLNINYSTLTKYLTGKRKNKTTLIYYTEE